MKNINFETWIHPDTEAIKAFANAFDIVYYKTESELEELFSGNSTLSKDIVMKRIRRLNTIYHTRLSNQSIDAVCNYLSGDNQINNIESRLHSDRPEGDILNEIASRSGSFVFATKYCSFINPTVYPIYDNLVGRVLNYFQRHDRFYSKERFLKLEEIRNERLYGKYIEIINSFRSFYELDCTYRELDKYMWLVGVNVSNWKQ